MIALAELNQLPATEFVGIVGPVFEHSPWIAETAAPRRPFASVKQLHQAMCAVVAGASAEQQLSLIRAHPDLVGRMKLTAESQREQAAAGLANAGPEEIAVFDACNRTYREKFGFPFVICARLNNKSAILQAFETRLLHQREQEIKIALGEIAQIAWLRLAEKVTEP